MSEPSSPSSTGPRFICGGIEGMRQRAALYLGSTDVAGLHRLLDEGILFYLEGALHGVLHRLEITLHADGSCSLRTDGLGLPCTHPRRDGTPGLLAACQWMYDLELYPKGWGTGRLPYLDFGLLPINAFSEWLEIAVRRESNVTSQRFERGQSVDGPVPEPPPAVSSSLHWLPDPSIFRGVTWNLRRLRTRLETLAFLVPAVQFHLTDERSGQSWRFHHPSGIAALVERLNTTRDVVHSPVHLRLSGPWGSADVALQYHSFQQCGGDGCGELLSFANLQLTERGVHVAALQRALTRCLNDLACGGPLLHEEDRRDLTWPDVRGCLRAVISVLVVRPEWTGARRQGLGNAELGKLLEEALRSELAREFSQDEASWRAIARELIWIAGWRPKRERALRLRRAERVSEKDQKTKAGKPSGFPGSY